MNKVIDYLINLYLYHNCEIYLLVPSRTDTKWFHRITQFMNEVYFIKGRLKFNDSKLGAPFPSCIIHISHDLPNNFTYHRCSINEFIYLMKGICYL